MSAMASQIIGISIVYLTACSCADQRKRQNLHVTGLCERNPPLSGDSPHKGPVTGKIFPFDDVRHHDE